MRRFIYVVVTAFGLVLGQQAAIVAALDTFFCESNPILYSCVNPCTTPSGSSGLSSSVNVTTGDGGGCGSSDPNANKQQIWSFLKGKGLTDEAAAGIMGNMEQESTFNPKATNWIGCRGIVQWCYGRNDLLTSYASERGKSWDCLGVQLEYMWYEMTETSQGSVNSNGQQLGIPLADALNGKPFAGSSNYTGSGAYNAGQIFHDYFERANTATGEDKGRGERAEKIYQEFTGKAPTPLGGSGSSGGSGCQGINTNGGPIPSANCKETQAAMQSLEDSGKIKFEKASATKEDIANCTEQKIDRSLCSQHIGGSRPQTLRGLTAIAQNSGSDSITLWNINEDHPCDEFDHPVGLASDIKQVNGVDCNSDQEQCKKVFDYAIAHKDELGISYIIWDGSYCQQKAASGPNVSCRSDHSDHIHISFKDS